MTWAMDGHLYAKDPHKMYGRRGGGGIDRGTATTGFGNLTTTPTKIPGTAYEEVIASNPVDMEQDLANGRIRVLTQGLWYLTGNITGLITPITANASNRINLGLHNETDSVDIRPPAIFTVPRYGDAFQLSVTALYEVIDGVNKWFSLQIWMENATPVINVTDLLSLELSVFRVS